MSAEPAKSVAAIDLRSDTLTRPCSGMRRAMAAAEVGDDVLREDPTVRALEERCAALFAKPAALFTPSGTMANLLAVLAQTAPGDELLTQRESHVYYYEAGGYAALAGCSVRFVDEGDASIPGTFTAQGLERALRPADDHFPTPTLVTLENTHNRGGGRVWPLALLDATARAARDRGLRVHIDGARLWNAAVALGVEPERIAGAADTLSACFSKGLGAPVGSILAGDASTIARARRRRKLLGGGMRQAGVLAAAALYALDHNRERLAEDHVRARRLAAALAGLAAFALDPTAVETNLVYVELSDAGAERGDAAAWEARLREHGVLCFAEGPARLRFVTHLDVDDAQVDEACRRIERAARA